MMMKENIQMKVIFCILVLLLHVQYLPKYYVEKLKPLQCYGFISLFVLWIVVREYHYIQ